jgi:hypothetical protein
MKATVRQMHGPGDRGRVARDLGGIDQPTLTVAAARENPEPRRLAFQVAGGVAIASRWSSVGLRSEEVPIFRRDPARPDACDADRRMDFVGNGHGDGQRPPPPAVGWWMGIYRLTVYCDWTGRRSVSQWPHHRFCDTPGTDVSPRDWGRNAVRPTAIIGGFCATEKPPAKSSATRHGFSGRQSDFSR